MRPGGVSTGLVQPGHLKTRLRWSQRFGGVSPILRTSNYPAFFKAGFFIANKPKHPVFVENKP